MIKDAIEYIVSAVASLKPKHDNPHRDIFGRVIEHGEEFFHPQTFKGIPVFDTESIMRHYKPILDKLQLYTDIGAHRRTPDGKQNLFDALYTDIIRRYIEFAHMIPASEDHHHAHTGGLIVHSLEVSIASLRYAKEVEIPRTGFSDIDNELRPIMHYCAWLAGLLHDAGKIMIDVSVDAAEIIHPLTRKPIPIKNAIPSWRPQKESLTSWAKAHNVAAYSVSFYNDRKHKRHNVDSAQIINPILQDTHALDFILSSPLNNETYSELCRVLAGYTKSKDYLSNAVRHGDADSTGRNIGIDYDRVRGTRSLSTASRIYQAIRNARKEWDWNVTNAEGWIIGGDVYLRWTSAIDSIAKVAKEMQHSLPADARNLLTIMESNGLVQMYDKSNRMIKFSPGGFKASDIPLISSGQRNIQWVDLFKMRGREMVFGADPMPDSIAGLIFLAESRTFIIIDRDGIATEFNGDTGQVTKTANTLPSSVSAQASPPPAATADLPAQSVVTPAEPKTDTPPAKKANSKKTNAKTAEQPIPASADTSDATHQDIDMQQPAKNQPKTLQFLPKQSTVSNSQAIDDMFGDSKPSKSIETESEAQCGTQAPEGTEQPLLTPDVAVTEIKAKKQPQHVEPETAPDNVGAAKLEQQSVIMTPPASAVTPSGKPDDAQSFFVRRVVAQPTEQLPVQNESPIEQMQVATKPKKCSPALSSLLDAKVFYHKQGSKILIDAVDAQNKTSLSLKEIISDLEKGGHLMISLNNPNQKLETIEVNQEKVKCIPVIPALYQYFSYPAQQARSIEASHRDTEHTLLPGNGQSPSNHDTATDKSKQGDNVGGQALHTVQNGNSAIEVVNKDTKKTASKKDGNKTSDIQTGNSEIPVATTTEVIPSGADSALVATGLSPKDVIAKISHSDARSFVQGGHPHVVIDWACESFSCNEEELFKILRSAKLLQIDITRVGGLVIEETTFEGAKYRTVMLRKQFAKFFSKNDAHTIDVASEEVKEASSQEQASTADYSNCSMKFIIDSSPDDSLVRFLSRFTDDIDSFFTAETDHVKVHTGQIRIVMTRKKQDFPFRISDFNRVIRANASMDGTLEDLPYSHVPHEKFKSILVSEIKK